MKWAFITALAALCLITPASAQSPSPIVQHYRAYRAAVERGDTAQAEVEAGAAFDASQARDGNGGRTPVLALNLALARLDAGHRAQAMQPAQLAQSLAGRASGVDPALASLVLARAELSQPDGRGAEHILSALQQPGARDLGAYAFEAASDLGRFSMEQHQYEQAQTAWTRAVELAPGEAFAHDYEQAGAYIGLGIATMMNSGNRGEFHGSETGSRLVRDADTSVENSAWTSFDAALRLMNNHIGTTLEPTGLTVAQQRYADALAWRAALESRMVSQNLPPPATTMSGIRFSNQQGRNACQVRLISTPEPAFPVEDVNLGRVGGITLRAVSDDHGLITDADVAAASGSPAFVASVENVARQWHFERTDIDANCTLAMTSLVPVSFRINDTSNLGRNPLARE